MPKTMPRSSQHLALAAGCGFWLAALTAGPASAEVRLPGESGEPLLLITGAILETGSETGADAGPDAGGDAAPRARARHVENVRGAEAIILQAEGQGAVSRMAIGMIGDTTAGGRIANSVTLGTSLNIAIGAGARACTEVGTLGRRGFCD